MSESLSPAGPQVLFKVAGSRWAFPVQAVSRVIHAVEITPPESADAAPGLMGTINVSGARVPIYDLSQARAREVSPEDMILLVQTQQGLAGYWAEEVVGVMQTAPGAPGAPGADRRAGAEELAIRLP